MKAAEIITHARSSPNNNLLCAVFAEKAIYPGAWIKIGTLKFSTGV